MAERALTAGHGGAPWRPNAHHPRTRAGAVLAAGVGAGAPAAHSVVRVPAEEAGRGTVGPSALLRYQGGCDQFGRLVQCIVGRGGRGLSNGSHSG